MPWKGAVNWAADRPGTLKLADWLGRGRGRMRFFDHVSPIPKPHRPDLSGWENQTLAAIWVGHATVLLRLGGMTILTDPVLSNRVGLGFGLFTGGPRRQVAPALALTELPPIDLILISHAHFDHLDRPTLNRLSKRTPVITDDRTADLIADLGFDKVTELRWGESLELGPIKLTAHEVRHWGARAIYDRFRGFNAYLLQSDGRRVLFGGDSAYCELFRGLGPVDLAMLPIGGYQPYIMNHASPEQAWEMAGHLRAQRILPMHHSTFRLSYEPIDEPMQRLLDAAGAEQDRIVIRKVGGQWAL